MKGKALTTFVISRFKREREELNRENYNSAMHFMVAQPTRKKPKDLKPYKPLFEDEVKGNVKRKKKKETAETVLKDFFAEF